MLCLRRLFINQRRLSTDAAKTNKSLLKELRSSTGFPFIKIRDALLHNDNDPVRAEAWLHEQAKTENWQKAQKLNTRNTTQGLVGLFESVNGIGVGSLLCETDFVAKNSVFVEMLLKVTKSVCDRSQGKLSSEEVVNLTSEDKSISEHIISTVGSLGENIKTGPSFAHTSTGNQSYSTYIHGAVENNLNNFSTGSHIGVVIFEGNVEKSLGKQIAQHVVGLNPKSVSSDIISDHPTSLVNQPMLYDPSKTVGQIAEEKGFKILDFSRITYLKPEEES